MTITQRDEQAERLYDYLCWYMGYWIQPPLLEDIAQDMEMEMQQVTQLLAYLETKNRIHPDSTMPKGCSGASQLSS